jgi:transcriptional regulator with XRE-family HTH domain
MSNKSQTILGKNIELLLAARGMSRSKLSYASEVHYHRIGMLIRGDTRDPQISTVQALADALGVTVDELITSPVDHQLSA